MEPTPPEIPFPVRFRGVLRPSQQDAVKIAAEKLARGQRRVHIVAPPGSGKTVLGLYLWAEHVKRPAVVLSPNSAIQSQWIARTDLFEIDAACPDPTSADPGRPGLLTSLTYQSVTLPKRGAEDLDAAAIERWQDRLIGAGQAENPQEAAAWIEDLRASNPEYFERRLGLCRKQVRDEIATGGEAIETLHRSSLDTLHRLRDRGVGLLVLDECHHLMGHWGRVLADARDLFDDPVVIGLTATPPDRAGRAPEDIDRYDEFFGPIDYQTPLPAVVKDGFLAPYLDLVYFVRPTGDELRYLGSADREFYQMVDDLCRGDCPDSRGAKVADTRRVPSAEAETGTADGTRRVPATPEPLDQWVLRVVAKHELPTGKVKDWASFERRDAEFAAAARIFLLHRGLKLPPGVPPPEVKPAAGARLDMVLLVPILDRYIRHRLRRSPEEADHELAERAIARLRVLGVQITDVGPRTCASPVGRVMGYSRAKTEGLLPVLKAEQAVLGDRIRAVVIADYEKTSAVTAEIAHLLDEEAGGAVAAFRALLGDPATDALDPILVTGSTVLVDDDLVPRFMESVRRWLDGQGLDIELADAPHAGFHLVTGRGELWCPRVYVAMITELFQQGVTKCLVGTRGLLGEGWDAHTVNVLVNLAVVTTPMSVNQLRGRSIRLDPADPEKLADNWDIVCIAPEFAKGLDDYARFIDRHKATFGLTDDGAIEKGVGHVHAALTELRPEGVEGSAEVLNAEMLSRPARRDEFRRLWRIGEPYVPTPIRAVEARGLGEGAGGGFPPFASLNAPWNAASLAAAVGRAVLGGLQEAGLLQGRYRLHVADRAGGYVRLFLRDASQEDGALFAQSVREALGPLERPRYVIPRYADQIRDTWLSNVLPEILGRYFRRRDRRMVTLHAVPAAFSKNKDLADIYAHHWNRHVSPGQAIYAIRGDGERYTEQARRRGAVPQCMIHDKEIFL